MKRLPIAAALVGAVLCLHLNGCRPAGAEATPALPLATVNGVDIRLAEAANGPVDPAHVEFLIDTQLLQEAAIVHELDRDPLVRQSVERATTAILAQAYLQSKAAALPAPTRARVDQYLARQADQFGQRSLYVIEQFVLASDDFTPGLKQQVDQAASLEQVAKWLDARGVRYERARLARHGSELEAPLLARLKTMRTHQLFVVVAGAQTTIDALREVRPDPVPEAEALAQAEAALREQDRAQAEQREIALLRSQARIAYYKQPPSSVPTTLGALP